MIPSMIDSDDSPTVSRVVDIGTAEHREMSDMTGSLTGFALKPS